MLAPGAMLPVLIGTAGVETLPLPVVRLMPHQPNVDQVRLFVEIFGTAALPVTATLMPVYVLETAAGGAQGQYVDKAAAVNFGGTTDANGYWRETVEIPLTQWWQWGMLVTALTGAGAKINVYASRGGSHRF